MATEEQVRVEFDDAGDAERLARTLEAALNKAFSRVSKDLGQELSKAFSKNAGFKKFQADTKDFGDQLVRGFREARREASSFQTTMNGLASTLNRVGSRFDIRGLEAQGEAFEGLSRLARRFEDDLERIAREPGLRKALGTQGGALRSEANVANIALQSITRVYERETQQQADAVRVAQQAQTAIVVAESKERIVAAQQEGAQSLAATRIASQRRIEIFRAAVGQIRALERGLGTLFSGTASALSSSFGALGGVISRFTSRSKSQFRELNQDMTQGLGSSLERRETIMRSSLTQQERILSTSITKQSAVLERFERQASTGVVGAVTGRSQLGTLLGGGLAIGGGFALFSKLKQGFADAVNFEEQLNKVNVLLGESAASVQNFATTAVESLGLTQAQALEAAGSFAGLLRPMGFTQQAAAEVSTRMTTLASDLASFNNIRVEDALLAIRSALVGEQEPIRRLGVNFNEATLKAKALELGLSNGKDTLDAYAKSQAVIALLFEQTALAQGDFARTSDQFANRSRIFQAQVTETFGQLALFLREPITILLGGLIPALRELTEFITGNVSGALKVLRDGLIGAGIALGGLLAARVAGEAVQFLGLMIKAALTPFGLLVLAVAGVGAAIKIMSDRSEGFRETMQRLKERAQELAGTGIEFLKDKLGDLADFITTSVIPRVQAFAEFVGREALERIRSFATFFRTEIIPRLQEFVAFIIDDVIPAVRGGLARGFEIASTAISNFWDVVQPILQPAIDGVSGLVDAITGLVDIQPGKGLLALGGTLAAALAGFTVAGPLGAAVAGIGAAVGSMFALGLGDELAGAISGIGDVILPPLQALGRTIQGFIQDFFTVDNALDIANSFLGVVEQIGFLIGRALSDPRLVTAVAAVAALAAAAAARFVIGFGRGLIENVPELAGLILKALSEALKFALRGLANIGSSAQGVAAAVAVLFTGATALGAWRRAGATAGTEAQKGFFSSLLRTGALSSGGAATRGGGPGAFLQGLFGTDTQIQNNVRRSMLKAQDAAVKQLQGMRAALTTAGRSFGLGDGVRTAFDQLAKDLGPAGVTGLRVKAGFQATLKSLRTFSVAPLRDLSRLFAVTGQGLGVSLGKGVAAGIAGGFAGLAVGRALGGQSGLEQALGLGGLVASISAISPPAGIAAGALGLLGLAMGNASADAKRAAAETQEYADALRDIDPALRAASAGSVVLENLADESANVQKLFLEAGFNAQEFGERVGSGVTDASDEIARLLEGIGAVRTAEFVRTTGLTDLKALKDALKDQGVGVGELRAALEALGLQGEDASSALSGAFDVIRDEGGELTGTLEELARLDAFQKIIDDADQAKREIPGVNQELSFLVSFMQELARVNGEQVAKNELLAGVVEQLQGIAREAQKAKDEIDQMFGLSPADTVQRSLDELIIDIQSIPGEIAGLDLNTAFGSASLNIGVGNFVDGFLQAINTGIDNGEITAVPQITLTRDAMLVELERALTAEGGGLSAAEVQFLADARLAIDQVILDPTLQAKIDAAQGTTPPEVDIPVTPVVGFAAGAMAKAVNDAVAAEKRVGSAGGGFGMSASLPGGGNAIPVSFTIAPQVGVNLAVAVLDAEAAGEAIGAAFADGIADSSPLAQLAATLSSIAAAAVYPSGSDLAVTGGRAVAEGFADGIADSSPLAQLAATLSSIAAAAVYPSGSDLAVTGGRAVAEGFARGIDSGRGAAIGAAQVVGGAAAGAIRPSSGQAFSAGVALSQGLAAGIRAGAGAAIGAARSLAQTLSSIVRSELQISSPSRVFANIGRQIAEGMAQGIYDGAETAVQAVNDAVDRIVSAATDRVASTSNARLAIFDLLQPGQGNVASRIGERASLSNIGVELSTVLERSRADILEAVAAVRSGEADARQRAIAAQFRAGAGTGSFNIATIIGAQNTRAFLDFGEQIRQFARNSLEAGISASTVVAQTRAYRNQLIASARSMGASSAEITKLIESLGLADTQLAEFNRQVEIFNRRSRNQTPGGPNQSEGHPDEGTEFPNMPVPGSPEEEMQRENERLRELLRIAGLNTPPIEVNVYPPYGDPEAIGVSAANRVLFELGPGT